MATYITFKKGQQHIINGDTIDRQCVVVVPSLSPEEGEKRARALFGQQFDFEYYHPEWIRKVEKEGTLQFTRGYIYIN